MRAIVSELPESFQYANLCRVSPIIKNKLSLRVGDLLFIRASQSGRKSFVRVMVDSFSGASMRDNRDDPFIEIDKCLMEYLKINPGDHVEVSVTDEPNEAVFVCFETTIDFTKDEKREMQQLIKSASWPIYPHGFFSLNVDGKPVNLMVSEQNTEPSIIGPDTTVSILGPSESENLRIQNEIMSMQIAINQAKARKKRLKFEIKKIIKENTSIEREIETCDVKIKNIQKEINSIEAQLEKIPSRRTELINKISSLDDEKKQIEEKLSALMEEFSKIGGFDIEGVSKRCDELEKKLGEELLRCEETLCRLAQQFETENSRA